MTNSQYESKGSGDKIAVSKNLALGAGAFLLILVALIVYVVLPQSASVNDKSNFIPTQSFGSSSNTQVLPTATNLQQVQPSADSQEVGIQDIYIRALSNGYYDKIEITVKKGIPVRLHFTADSNAGCGRQIVLYGLNVQATSMNGQEQVVDFTPKESGTYDYSCGMRMWGPGKLIVQ
ncbi:MAG: cupredoxin domain-containing protein [Candidatus Micrarchaeota archaeon]